MKKAFITLFTVLIASVTMAAGHVDSVRYLTTRFGKNWFISADVTANWWQGSMRTPEGFANSYTKVEWGKPTFGFDAYLGKWINHKTGVRVGYSNTKINSYINGRHIGLDGIQFLYGDNPTPVETVNGFEIYSTSLRYHRVQADFMVRPIDFFQGYYSYNQVWSPVLYLRAGAAHTSKDLFALQTIIHNASKENANKLDGSNFELAMGAGLCNNFRISEHFDLNLDLNWTFQRWTIDSWTYEFEGTYDGKYLRPKRADNMYTAALGLTYYFSRVYDLPYNYEKEMGEMRDRIKNLEDELANQPTPEAVHDTIVKFVNSESTETLSYPFSIFFNLDSYELMSGRDRVNLREIAKAAKENNYKLHLRGSADSATASSSYNQTLSENRCNKIKKELLEMGVPAENIILEPVGGVKELDPTEYDRRVLIYVGK